MTRFRHPGRFGAAYPPLRSALLSAALLAGSTAHAARPMITESALNNSQAIDLQWVSG